MIWNSQNPFFLLESIILTHWEGKKNSLYLKKIKKKKKRPQILHLNASNLLDKNYITCLKHKEMVQLQTKEESASTTL
jgi:hypothetical protein